MRKIILTEYLTLDGVMEEPTWTMPYWNDEIAKYKFDELFSSDALLLGRVTYQGFAAAWPSQKDEQGFANRMNNLPKYVVSTTLEFFSWNNSQPIQKNLLETLDQLKQQTGKNILIYGSATLANFLMEQDRIDEYRLLVYPLVLGKGKRLFQNERQKLLKLIHSTAFGTGVTALTYIPAGHTPASLEQ
jgi:dihydrofolate reductase